jgi:hypothetical protein
VEYAAFDANGDNVIVFGIVGKIAVKNRLAEVKCALWGFVRLIERYLIKGHPEKVQGGLEVWIRHVSGHGYCQRSKERPNWEPGSKV